jgi:hypothetical protein
MQSSISSNSQKRSRSSSNSSTCRMGMARRTAGFSAWPAARGWVRPTRFGGPPPQRTRPPRTRRLASPRVTRASCGIAPQTSRHHRCFPDSDRQPWNHMVNSVLGPGPVSDTQAAPHRRP